MTSNVTGNTSAPNPVPRQNRATAAWQEFLDRTEKTARIELTKQDIDLMRTAWIAAISFTLKQHGII